MDASRGGYESPLKHTHMIRKNSKIYNILRQKSSSKSLFDSFMEGYSPKSESCPTCRSSGNCIHHGYYCRMIIDYIGGKVVVHHVMILRVFCKSCGHTHAILPDFLIPYVSYGLFFVLQVLTRHFLKVNTLEALCEKYDLDPKTIRRWINVFNKHKLLTVGSLDDHHTSQASFIRRILKSDLSGFLQDFLLITSYSFLQSHQNPANCRSSIYT